MLSLSSSVIIASPPLCVPFVPPPHPSRRSKARLGARWCEFSGATYLLMCKRGGGVWS